MESTHEGKKIILHVDGAPGVGKSTLITLVKQDTRFRDFAILDLDELSDELALKGRRNDASAKLDAFIASAEHHVVMFGLSVDHAYQVATHGFFLIREPLSAVVRDLNVRHLEIIASHTPEIRDALQHENYVSILSHKFHLRLPFPVELEDHKKNVNFRETIAKTLTYTVGTREDFFSKFGACALSNLVNTPILAGRPNRIIAHIAGSPGAGKNYIGEELKKKFAARTDIVFVDTDTLYEIPGYRWQHDEILRGVDYRENLGKAIVRFLNLNADKHVVLFGLTVYYAWDIVSGFEKGTPFPIHLLPPAGTTLYKYFIDIDLDTLVKQRFERDVDLSAAGIKAVLNGSRRLDFSREEMANYAEVERREYGKMNYSLENQRGSLRISHGFYLRRRRSRMMS